MAKKTKAQLTPQPKPKKNSEYVYICLEADTIITVHTDKEIFRKGVEDFINDECSSMEEVTAVLSNLKFVKFDIASNISLTMDEPTVICNGFEVVFED